MRITRVREPYASFSCFTSFIWIRLTWCWYCEVCYISKADILTVISSYYIVIFSLWGCIYIVIKSPHNIFKDELNCLNSLRVYQYRRAHRFSWHNYTSKIKCRAPTELLTRALFFWGRSRFSFPFLFKSSQRDLGRCPSALSCPGFGSGWGAPLQQLHPNCHM